MSANEIAEHLSQRRLAGEPLPPDLALLAASSEGLEDWGYRLVTEPDDRPWDDHNYLTPEDLANPDIAASVKAMTELNGLIAFVVAHEDGEYLGYWRGRSARPIAECPVVSLDNEGQYALVGSSIAAGLTWHSADEELAEWLAGLGIEDAPAREVEDDPGDEADALFAAYQTA